MKLAIARQLFYLIVNQITVVEMTNSVYKWYLPGIYLFIFAYPHLI